jgi:AbrB family looped-hinge helix DNA binding protein
MSYFQAYHLVTTMETVKLSSKGQIVIPKEIRETQHLAVGTEFFVSYVEGQIRLTPAPVFPKTKVGDGLGMLARKGTRRLSDEEATRAIGGVLKERDAATKR